MPLKQDFNRWIDSVQLKDNEAECRKCHPSEYEKFISIGSKSYEEYEKER
jgi:hypothetical protein